MKYVITDHNKIVLGSGTLHIELAQSISGNVVGAAHARFEEGKVVLHGESATYGTIPTEEDARWFADIFHLPVIIEQ